MQEGQGAKQLKEEVADLEAKLARKDEVLGDVMEGYVTLKNVLGPLNGQRVTAVTWDEV